MDLSPELTAALMQRLQVEYAETAVSNFLLDIIVADLKSQVAVLTEHLTNIKTHNVALAERNRELMTTVDDLRKQIPRKRGKDIATKP